LKGFTLDTGALIALERRDEFMLALLQPALEEPDAMLHVPAGVVAQAFRDGARQARLMRLLGMEQTKIVALDARTAFAAGLLLGKRGSTDAVDASVVVCARVNRQSVVTSDPDDLHRLDPGLRLEIV
jgi:PIN domain